MEQKTLIAVPRQRFGTSDSRRLRRIGKIPAVMYGHSDPKGLTIDAHEFNSKFITVSESTIINLKIDGTEYNVLIRDYQEDAISGAVTHVDFYEIEMGKSLRTNVGVTLNGIAIGVREGGLLESFVHDIEVECLPKDLPEQIELEITDLQIGHSIHVRDIDTPEGVKILNSPDQVICTVAHKRVEVEEVPEAAEEEALEEEAAEEVVEEEQTEE
jgi:large subunit ribosomal protein L25